MILFIKDTPSKGDGCVTQPMQMCRLWIRGYIDARICLTKVTHGILSLDHECDMLIWDSHTKKTKYVILSWDSVRENVDVVESEV